MALQFDRKSSFGKAYKKLNRKEQGQVDELVRDLATIYSDPTCEDAKILAHRRRIKVINKFRRSKPPRMEATWAGNGRLAFTIEKGILVLVYVGDHRILDKD